MLEASFQQYYNPACELSADECMIAFQGRWGGRQYDRSKPIQWGVKVWMVTDAKTTFNYNFDVYCGKSPNFEHQENFGVKIGAIIKLTQNLYVKGHIIFTDCYYISPGTVQKNCAAERKVVKRQQSVSTHTPITDRESSRFHRCKVCDRKHYAIKNDVKPWPRHKTMFMARSVMCVFVSEKAVNVGQNSTLS